MATEIKDDYELNIIKRQFSRLTHEQKQEAWLSFSESMEDYAKDTTAQFELEVMADHTDEAMEHYKNWGKMAGYSTGYEKLDKLTKGLVGGELTIVAGKTSYGKTTLGINIANKLALAGTPVLFVTLEMTKAELTSRFLHINGGLTDNYLTVANMVTFQATDELDWKSVDKLVEKFVAQFSHGLIVIDHLHYFTRELENVAEDLGRLTKEFKKNAIRHNVPIILISHVRKTTKGAQATLEDLRGSSYIAQDADIVLMVGRDATDGTRLAVRVEKNRNRGFDYKDDTAEMYIDGIIIHNSQLPDWSAVYND